MEVSSGTTVFDTQKCVQVEGQEITPEESHNGAGWTLAGERMSSLRQRDLVDKLAGDGNQVVNTEETFKNKFEKEFLIDGGIVNKTMVVIQPNNLLPLNATKWLVDPRGQVCHECTERAEGGGAVISLPNPAKVGTWTLHLENHSPDEVMVTIQVKSRTRGGEPIRLFNRFSKASDNSSDNPTVLARVTKGKQVVLKAPVYATVTGPEVNGLPHKSTFRLYDDGKVPDVHRNDGWYSGFFMGYAGHGTYYVSVSVSKDPRTRLSPCWDGSGSSWDGTESTYGGVTIRVSDVPIPGGAPSHHIDKFPLVNTTSEDEDTDTVEGSDLLDNFTRTVYVGQIEVTSDIYDEDLPPGPIRDLKVADVQPGSNGMLLVQLTWTWPGAHLITGMASSVTIRASQDFTGLTSNFDNQTAITSANVVAGNLDPLPARTTHVVTIALPATFTSLQSDGHDDCTAQIAIRVTNSYGRSSDTSNVVCAWYADRPVETGVTVKTETEMTVTSQTGVTVTTETDVTVTSQTGVTAPTETANDRNSNRPTVTTETATSSTVKIHTTKKVFADEEDSESSAWFVLISVCIVILVLAAVLLALYITAVKKRIEENTRDDLLTEKSSKSQAETATETVD
ncbi:calcium-activated chloride channel regulator 2-like isoform X1 [Haemaphysalis longicornis]